MTPLEVIKGINLAAIEAAKKIRLMAESLSLEEIEKLSKEAYVTMTIATEKICDYTCTLIDRLEESEESISPPRPDAGDHRTG